MKNFTYKDFVTDNIPDCYFTNSNRVHSIITKLYPKYVDNIQSIELIGNIIDDVIYHEWLVIIDINGKPGTLRFPIYRSKNKEYDKIIMQKHNLKLNLDKIIVYQNEQYLLLGNIHPCIYTTDDKGNSQLQMITMWGSQKMVQSYLSDIMSNEYFATLVKINYSHTYNDLKDKNNLQDIAWLVGNATDSEDIQIMPIDYFFNNHKIIFSVNSWDELKEEDTFHLNLQKYIVKIDDENGIFIKKSKNSS